MKPRAITTTLLLAATTTSAQLIPFLTNGEPTNLWNPQRNKPQHQNQNPMPPSAPGIQLPPNPENDGSSRPSGDVILSDILTTDRRINVFAGLTRDIPSVSARLDDKAKNSTVLAPLNSAITSLPRKPWEDPADYDAMGAQAYAGKQGEDRAQRNLRRFVEGHVVPASPWEEGVKVERVGGGEVWWERREGGEAVVMPGGVEVEKVASRVANGEVWVLKGVLNYAA